MTVEIAYEDGEVSPEFDSKIREVASVLSSWTNTVQPSDSILSANRGQRSVARTPYGDIASARGLVDDDIVSGSLDALEGLAFQTVRFEAAEDADADVMNQIARDLDMDSLLRNLLREVLIYSQVTIATWWDAETYTPRPRPSMNAPALAPPVRIRVPKRVRILDPSAVVPVGDWAFDQGRLALQVPLQRMEDWPSDPALRGIVEGVYTPVDWAEQQYLTDLGADTSRLLLLRADRVFRHTLSRGDYERFPTVRLASLAKTYDLKQQLQAADRVALRGFSHFLILVRKGTKEQPATNKELQSLRQGVNVMAQMPVLVGDHRLQVDLISMDLTNTLSKEKYNVLDDRIYQRVMGALIGRSAAESAAVPARIVSRRLESLRHMLKRFLEASILRTITDQLQTTASMTFFPAGIELASDTELYAAAKDARDRGEISRQSYLETLGYDAALEFSRILREKLSGEDDIVQPHTPFDSPNHGARG